MLLIFFCMDWWILFILQLFHELFHDVEKFIDFFETGNCVFPVMKNCSSKFIFFHTHTHKQPLVLRVTVHKRPHTQHPEQKNAKWFLIYRFALLGMFFSWVASVSQLLNDMFAQNIGKMPRSPSPSRFSHYQILHAISSSTNHRENVTWPYFLPAMSWLLVGGLLEWSLPIRPRFCETR